MNGGVIRCPVHVFLAPDALRVLAGHGNGAGAPVDAEAPLALS